MNKDSWIALIIATVLVAREKTATMKRLTLTILMLALMSAPVYGEEEVVKYPVPKEYLGSWACIEKTKFAYGNEQVMTSLPLGLFFFTIKEDTVVLPSENLPDIILKVVRGSLFNSVTAYHRNFFFVFNGFDKIFIWTSASAGVNTRTLTVIGTCEKFDNPE